TLGSKPPRAANLEVLDAAGRPVAGADVVLEQTGKRQASGRTDDQGKIAIVLEDRPGTLTITSLARGSKTLKVGPNSPPSLSLRQPETGPMTALIADEQGGPIPCKVQFLGRNGTPSPDFGPDSGEHAVKNVYYSENGHFRRELAPGSYDVIVSHGPEYDAV